MQPREWEALYSLLHLLETRWQPNEQPDASVYHAYDPLPLEHFLKGVRIASENTEGRRFLDLGCGIGSKLAFMHYLGWKVAGVERYAGYVAQAEALIPEAEVKCCDILDIDVIAADLVYMYRPAKSDEDEEALEEHVAALMPPSSVLFLPVRQPSALGGATQIEREIWQWL